MKQHTTGTRREGGRTIAFCDDCDWTETFRTADGSAQMAAGGHAYWTSLHDAVLVVTDAKHVALTIDGGRRKLIAASNEWASLRTAWGTLKRLGPARLIVVVPGSEDRAAWERAVAETTPPGSVAYVADTAA